MHFVAAVVCANVVIGQGLGFVLKALEEAVVDILSICRLALNGMSPVGYKGCLAQCQRNTLSLTNLSLYSWF